MPMSGDRKTKLTNALIGMAKRALAGIETDPRSGVRCFSKETAAAGDCIVEYCEKAGVHVGRRSMENAFRNMVGAAYGSGIRSGDALAPRVSELVDSLPTEGKRWTVFVPIAGIHLPDELADFDFSGVRIVRLRGDAPGSAWGEVAAIVRGQGLPPEEEAAILQNMEIAFQGWQDAAVRIQVEAGDEAGADDLATEIAGRFCDLLQLTVGYYRDPGVAHDIVPLHGAEASLRSALVCGDGGSFLQMNNVRPECPIDLDVQTLGCCRDNLAEAVTTMLKPRSGRTELERRLVDAIEWAALAAREARVEAQPLKYFTGFERLLRPYDFGGAAANALGELTAQLIGAGREDALEVASTIRKLYSDCRSGTVHGAKPSVSGSDVAHLHSLLLRLICAVSSRLGQWESVADLHRWAEGRRYDSLEAERGAGGGECSVE